MKTLKPFNGRLQKKSVNQKAADNEVSKAETQDQPIIKGKPAAAAQFLIVNDPAVANSLLDRWAKEEADSPSDDLSTQYTASYILGANEWAATAGLRFADFPNRESFLFAVLKARGVGYSGFARFCNTALKAREYRGSFTSSYSLYLQNGRLFSAK